MVVRPPWTIARSAAAWCSKRSGTKARTSIRGLTATRQLVEPRARDQDHACRPGLVREQREGLRTLLQEAPADAGTPDRHQDHALAVAIAKLVAAARRGRAYAADRSGTCSRRTGSARAPTAHVRQIRAERAVEHVLLVADQDRQVAHVGVQAEVIDVLGVLLPARG